MITPHDVTYGPTPGISMDHGGGSIPVANADGDIAIGGAGAANSGASGNGTYAITFGDVARAIATNTVAFGANSTASMDGGTVVGYASTASQAKSTLVGRGSSATSEGDTVIGTGVTLNAANAVAIGSNLTASRANTVTLGSSGTPWQIVNLAAGTDGFDAVNVSQLLPLVNGLGGGTSFNASTGAVTGPAYNVQGGTFTDMGGTFGALDAAVTTNTGNLADIVNNFDDGLVGLVRQSAPGSNLTFGAGVDGTITDFSGVADTRKLTGLSVGTLSGTSTEAVNGAQLNDTHTLLDTRDTQLTTIEGNILDINSQLDAIQAGVNNVITYDDASEGQVTFGGGASGTLLTNVADGLIAAGSMDAINGDQMANMRDSFQNLIGGLDDQVGAIEDALKPIVDADMGGSTIVNVGNAQSNTDLANIGQLNEYMQAAVDQAMNYTDAQVGASAQAMQQLKDDVNDRFNKQDARISRMGAMSTAMNMMAFSTQGIKTRNRGGVGVGTQNGYSAVSVGYSRALNEKMNVSVAGSTSGSDNSAGVSFGMNW